jgi:hypothetical protein
MSDQKSSPANMDYVFSKEEIESLLQTQQDYLDGKTAARDWEEIEEELNRKYNYSPNQPLT